MKQILNINLGGHPVTIDTDAYDHLSIYLDTIERHFNASEATEEILSDIETRMAELFKENIHPRTIVTLPDVNAAIDIMGTPEMFGAGTIEEDESTDSFANKSTTGFKPGKRLFRDPDEKILAGVSSGLAAYLGVQDPIWLRIVFIVFTVAGFASIPIYLILWIAMPIAKTAADRLAMKGEPINVDSIASSVSEEFENLSEKFSNLGSKKKRKNGGPRVKNNWLAVVGDVFAAVIVGFGRTARPVLRVLGGLLIVVLLLVWITVVIASALGLSKASFYMPTNLFAFGIGIGSLFLLVGAPLIGLIIRITRIFFKSNPSKNWQYALIGLWILGSIGISFSVSSIAQEFKYRGNYEQSTVLLVQNKDPLVLKYDEKRLANNDARKIRFGGKYVKFNWHEIHLEILPAEGDQIKLVQIQTALGASEKDADNGSENFEYKTALSANNLSIPSNYFIPKGDRFRAQKIRLKLYIPKGQKITLDEKLRNLNIHMNRSSGNYKDYFDTTLLMTESGLVRTDKSLSSIKNVFDEVQVPVLRNFKSIEMVGSMVLNIRQGDFFRVKVRGDDQGVVKSKVVNGRLFLSMDQPIQDAIEVYITMPVLDHLSVENASYLTVSGFEQEHFNIDLDGDFEAKLQGVFSNLRTNVQGGVVLTLKGETLKLIARLKNNAQVKGAGLLVKKTEVSVAHNAKAELLLNGVLTHY